jgi:hypothetical protein
MLEPIMAATRHFAIRGFASVLLALLGLVLVLVGLVGVSGVAAILVRLGIIREHALDFATLGYLTMWLVMGGILLLSVGLVLTFARGVARAGAWMLLSGLVLLLAGSGPLVAVGLAAQLGYTTDPNPNPVFLGILAFLTIGPALLLVCSGAVVFAVGKWRRR